MSEVVAESHYKMIGLVIARLGIGDFHKRIDSLGQIVVGDFTGRTKRLETESFGRPVDIGKH